MNRDRIVTEARTWIGTKFHHQSSIKGVACDCLGLFIEVSKALNIQTRKGVFVHQVNRFDYSPRLHVSNLEEVLNIHFHKKDNIEPGDLGLFSIGGYNQHLGIFGSLKYGAENHLSLIHADSVKGEVCEHVLDEKWKRRMVSVFIITEEK